MCLCVRVSVSVCVVVVVVVAVVVVVVVTLVVIVTFNKNAASELTSKDAVRLYLSRCWNTNCSLYFYKSTEQM